jgi:hypothetical protein
MQKIEHFTPPTSPKQHPPLMSNNKYVMSKELLGLTGTNCPIDTFVSKIESTCSCLPGPNYSKKWSYNSNYGDMYMCQ